MLKNKKKKIPLKKIIKNISCAEKKVFKVHKYCIAIMAVLVLALIVTVLIYPRYLNTQASTPVSFSQSNWSGSGSADPAVIGIHPNDWNGYESKNNVSVNSSSQIELSPSSTDTNTVLLLHGDGADGSTNFIDSSNYGNTITTPENTLNDSGNPNDAHISTTQSVFGGSSIKFDGVGDYLEMPPSNNLNFGVGDFTIETYINFNTYLANNIFMQANANSTNAVEFVYGLPGDPNSLYFLVKKGGPNLDVFFSAPWPDPGIGTWHHVAITRQGPNLYMFADGNMIGSPYPIGNYTMPDMSTSYIQIGSQKAFGFNGYTYYMNGYMDDYRITKGLARYTDTILPTWRPTESFHIYTYDTGASGELTSSVIDAGSTVEWSSATLNETVPTNTLISLQTRTSSDNSNWSGWQDVFNGAIQSPNGQYIQYKVSLSTSDEASTPVFKNVTLSGIIHIPAPALSFTNDVVAGPVRSNDISVYWDNAILKEWKYGANILSCSDLSGYTDATVTDVPAQINGQTHNGDYICLYAENSNGNPTVLASSNPIAIDITGPTLSFVDIVLSGPVANNTITAEWSADAIVKGWKYSTDIPCSNSGYTFDTNIPVQTDSAHNSEYICLYGEDALGNISVLNSDNTINIDANAPLIHFIDSVELGPVQRNVISVDWADAIVTKWMYNSGVSCPSDILLYQDGPDIPTQADTTNNHQYICLYAEDAVGNKAIQSSDNPINIDITPPTLSFIDGVESGPVQSDTIVANWGDAEIKKWMYSTTKPCPTDGNLYTIGTSIPTQADETNNGNYVCLYGKDTAGNEAVLGSANAINISLTPPPTYIPEVPGTPVGNPVPPFFQSNTLEEVQATPVPDFPASWGANYQLGRAQWALDHRRNIYQLYVDYLDRYPSAVEVNWQFAHESDINNIRFYMLISPEYLSKHK